MKSAATVPASVIVLLCMLLIITGCGSSRKHPGTSARDHQVAEMQHGNNGDLASSSDKSHPGRSTPSVLTAEPAPSSPASSSDNVSAETSLIARKTAFLTFDDGPSANTEKILAILHRFGIKATFFVIGDDTERGRRLYRRIAEEGHTLGNHTYSHRYERVYTSPAAFRQDVEKLNALLLEATGRRPELLRFPGGSNNKLSRRFGGKGIMERVVRLMSAEGYAYFDWNVSSTDAALPLQATSEIVGAVLGGSRGRNNIIVLMHDVSAKTTTVEALPSVIRGLIAQGYRFQALQKDSFTFQFKI